MKKLLTLLMLAGVFTFSATAQEFSDTDTTAADTAQAEEVYEEPVEEIAEIVAPIEEEAAPSKGFHQVVKEQFIDGGPTFMGIVLACLILGLAIAIERIIHLNMASTNTKKLLTDVEDALNAGGADAAKEVCRNTRGPVASIFTQGLMRMSEGVEMVEKSIIAYGSVEMGKLERGMIWISLFISLAPMLGFMGTVIGMIEAFDA
ncbi:MAG: MotA/TolQ/ExbB proton channel family protein, partial [Ekhidna sp.]